MISLTSPQILGQDQFDTKVYGIVIQSLVEEPGPLPTLFMRTVIQVARHLAGASQYPCRC